MEQRHSKSAGNSQRDKSEFSMPLAQHILDELGLDSSVDKEGLANALESSGLPAPEPLYSEDGRLELLRLFEQSDQYSFFVASARTKILAWNYHTVQVDLDQVGEMLEIPSVEGRDSPPTNGEKLLIGLWNHNLAEYEKAITGDCVVAAWNKYKQVDGR